MSRRFYLNDCLPAHVQNGTDVVKLFRDMVADYKEMHKNQVLELELSWVMSDFVDNVKLCGVNLKNLLAQLKATERELYSYASRLVTSGTQITYEEGQLEGDTEVKLDFKFSERNAHNLIVAQKLDMIAASLPVEDALYVDKLKLLYTEPLKGKETNREIDNWYVNKCDGKGNTAFIVKILTPPLPPETQPWERLNAILGQHGKVHCSKIFKNNWEKLGSEIQQLIVNRFIDALNAQLLFPANDKNKNIVKSDQKDRTSRVHELRQKGDAFRIYFECDDDAIYLALYATKTCHHGVNQEADFRIAKNIVERLRKEID